MTTIGILIGLFGLGVVGIVLYWVEADREALRGKDVDGKE